MVLNPRVDIRRIGLLFGSILISILVGSMSQPYLHGNEFATSMIVNVFAILAGFLITTMTLLGDHTRFAGQTWRRLAATRTNAYNRLFRRKLLFLTYLLTIALIFISNVVADNNSSSSAAIWIEYAYLSVACWAFLVSLSLPGKLMKFQLARFDEEVEMRRAQPAGQGGE